MKRILVISPHTDDAEFGCGAFMWTMASRGAQVLHVLLTVSEKTGRSTREQAIKEFNEANDVLSVKTDVRFFEHRQLQRDRQELLDFFIVLRDNFDPDTVLIPCLDDTHQDHAAVAIEGFRAFKGCDLLGYDILWNNIAFASQAFFVFDEAALDKKIESLMRYKSQIGRHYFDEDLIRSAARMRGAQAGVKYAEGFSNIRRFIR